MMIGQDLDKSFRNDINELISKYQTWIERVDESIKQFPDEDGLLTVRKNIYKDIILDLRNVLEWHKEDI